MPIAFKCGECGAKVKASDTSAGRTARCPRCKSIIAAPLLIDGDQAADYPHANSPQNLRVPIQPTTVVGGVPQTPAAANRETDHFSNTQWRVDNAQQAASQSAKRRQASEVNLSSLRWTYWAFSLTLLPLVLSVYSHVSDVETRLAITLKKNPELENALSSKPLESLEDIFRYLPGRKIDGALLPRDSWWHWGFAGLSAAGFFAVILLFFNRGLPVGPLSLLGVGLLVGTIGILLLLGFQIVASWSLGISAYGRSVVALFFYLIKFIGFPYRCALDPANGFWLSFMGFTLGVGLCEELCKGLPMVVHFSREGSLDEGGAAVYGLACGAGFGIAEGIHYSSINYNGIGDGMIYLVRFVSCVGLHSIWSGTAGILICRFQESLQGDQSWLEWLLSIILILSVPMILHGLYDTLLKKDLEAWAVAVAFLSFGCLAALVEISGGAPRADS